ncbi:Signal transduction histidine kinase [Bacillus sp. OV166]|uniref:sensor histidine kinase n=1 Tax=Bacillus sp. OV166 TaxID=1882763 RepID=UPI000A2AB219|nr:ATP-binding protein [Bacillus sp. OV166]SMQ86866.1 Signal transduction histidine kinase [Bacillus sp. OV166]
MKLFERIIKHLTKMNTSLLFQFTSWYVLYFFAAIMFISFAVWGTVSYFLIQNTKSELQAIEEKLIYLINEDYDELQVSLDEFLYPDHANYFVEIKSQKNKLLARSRGWNKTRNGEEVNLNWLEAFFWDTHEGLYYKTHIPWLQPNHQNGTIFIKIQLNNIANFQRLIQQILFFAGIISLTAGSVLIYHLTKRKLKPLLMITHSVEQIRGFEDLKKRIPVPKTSYELIELSSTFNDLLERIDNQFNRETNFVSNASHELRTPLTAFRGHLKLIKRWGKEDPKILNNSIQVLDDESKRMERIMIQLLELARNEHLVIHKQHVNFSSVIEGVINQLGKQSLVEIVQYVEPNIIVEGDEEQLRRIGVILIENAIRYTNEKGKVTIKLQKDKGQIIFIVSDTGIGIPPEEQNKIFDRFYRVDKHRSRLSGGTGLGLSIATEIVKKYNGRITLESQLGYGSTFTVQIPAER